MRETTFNELATVILTMTGAMALAILAAWPEGPASYTLMTYSEETGVKTVQRGMAYGDCFEIKLAKHKARDAADWYCEKEA